MKDTFRKPLIWFLIVAIAIGYNFAGRLPKDEKSQSIKITPKQNSFKVSENPKFTLEINKSKSLRRFFRLVMLPWPVARAEEKVDFTEEIQLSDGADYKIDQDNILNLVQDDANNDVIASPESPISDEGRSNPGAESNYNNNDEIATRPPASQKLQRGESDARNDTEIVTTTDFVIETPNPQVLGEIIASEVTVTETTTEFVIVMPKADPPLADELKEESDEVMPTADLPQVDNPSGIATTTSWSRNDEEGVATSTDASLLGQALEKVGDLIEQVGEIAEETLKAEPQVEVSVYDPTGEESEAKVEIKEIQDNQYEIALDDQGQKLPRGDYELEVQVRQGPLRETQRQSFNWGGREIPELRTYTSKTYDNLDGSKNLEAHIGQIHYENKETGQLEDINTTLIDQGDIWTMEKAGYHAQIPKYADEIMVFEDVFEDKDQTIEMIPQAQHTEGQIENTDGWENQRVRYKDAYGPNIDLRVTVGNIGLFKEVIVNQKPENLNQDLVFDFEIELPEGKVIYTLNNETGETKKIINLDNFELSGESQLLIGPDFNDPNNLKDSNDPDFFSYIRKIRIWDSAGNAASGKLHFYQKDGQLYFQKIIPREFLENAAYPVYTDDTTSYYVGAGDGRVYKADSNNWATTHDNATGQAASATDSTAVRQVATGANNLLYVISRAFYPVDTSALPSGATIDSASFSLYLTATEDVDNDGNDFVVMVQTSQANSTTLVTSDYNECSATTTPTEGSGRTDITSITGLPKYATGSLNSTGLGWVKRSGETSSCGTTAGVTCLGMREGHDVINEAYAGTNNNFNALTGYFSEYTGTANDPYLSVTYHTLTITGTIYSDDGSTIYNCSTNNLTVAAKVNGAGTYSTTCTAAGGTYTLDVVASAAGDIITVWIDGEDSPSVKATTVTRAAGASSDISGFDIYQNCLIVRNEDGTEITNSNLSGYDKDNDSDIHFTSNGVMSKDLTVDNDTELHVWTGKSFAPGGLITTSPGGSAPGGDIHFAANSTFTSGGALSIGGSWTAGSNVTITNLIYYTLTFTATNSGKTITTNSSDFTPWSVTFNGSGGEWTFQDNATTTTGVTITAGAVTGPSSGHLTIGDWANNGGTFTPNNCEVKFRGGTLSSSGSGNLIFYDVNFDSASGSIVQNNATSTRNWKLTDGTFTLSSGKHIEVNGQFTNITSDTTTWTGSYLYLNSGSAYTVNTKSAGSDTYATLEIGSNTDIRMWDSSAVTYNVSSSGSLYSMDHAGTSGDLAIYGDYHVPSASTDYWSYATDFDGTASANRQVDVLLADGAAVNVDSGTTLNILGTNTATTTATSTSSTGSYGFTLNNGTLNAQYYKFGRLNASGLNLTGASATITNLANGEFDNSAGTGASDTFITVAGATITNNAAKTFSMCRFDNTNGNANYNVTATGSTASYWTFSNSYGAFDGEAYDSDPGGDPGYIRWDDSTSGTLSETASSSATFASVTYSFTSQNDTGNKMGAVYISDSRGGAPGWDLNVTSADWSTGGGSSTNSPGTMADDATVGTITWTDPDNAKVSDNVYATAILTDGEGGGATSHYLKATNFGFSIPTGATIDGIVVEIETKVSLLTTNWSNVRIVKGGTISTTTKSSSAGSITTTDSYSILGSSSDLWGETWTPADINSSTFGVVSSISTASLRTISVDHIRITVYYTGGSMDYDGDGIFTGQLCLVLSGAAIYAITGSMTGVTKGSDDCFDSGTSQIQIGDATVGNGVGTYWLVDQTMSQFIPAMQQAGVYTTTLSIVAS